jgi:hypothetical protein
VSIYFGTECPVSLREKISIFFCDHVFCSFTVMLTILITFIYLYCTYGTFKCLHCSLYSEIKLPTTHKYSNFSSSTGTRFCAYNAAPNALVLLAPVALIRGVHRVTASTVRVDLTTSNSG